MPSKTAVAKLKREKKKAVVVFIIFVFLSLGINFTLGGIGAFMGTVDEFSHIGNVEFVVQGLASRTSRASVRS